MGLAEKGMTGVGGKESPLRDALGAHDTTMEARQWVSAQSKGRGVFPEEEAVVHDDVISEIRDFSGGLLSDIAMVTSFEASMDGPDGTMKSVGIKVLEFGRWERPQYRVEVASTDWEGTPLCGEGQTRLDAIGDVRWDLLH
jgi:hypothetical protein